MDLLQLQAIRTPTKVVFIPKTSLGNGVVVDCALAGALRMRRTMHGALLFAVRRSFPLKFGLR